MDDCAMVRKAWRNIARRVATAKQAVNQSVSRPKTGKKARSDVGGAAAIRQDGKECSEIDHSQTTVNAYTH